MNNESRVWDPVEINLASPLLKCGAGDFDDAEREILGLLYQNAERCNTHPETFNALIKAIFIVQRFDVVAAMLRDRFGFASDFTIDMVEKDANPACVRWEILPSGEHRFVFDSRVYQDDSAEQRVQQFHWAFPLFSHYASHREQETGSVLVNQWDRGISPGLAYSDNRPDYFLVPDNVFVSSKGYDYARKVLTDNQVPWPDRRPGAFWRGATTGPKAGPRDWRSLDRIKLCTIALRHEHTGLIDAGISQVAQFSDPAVEQEIKEAGLLKGFVPWQDWGQWKYQIDIDGNSSPWSNTFQRLLTGSPLLKVESQRGMLQWFHDEFVPWHNYVPIAPDMSDLMDKIQWLNRHDTFTQKVGQNGRQLADRLTYERELQRSVPVISAAFRYFRGEMDNFAPYGWVAERRGNGSPTSQLADDRVVPMAIEPKPVVAGPALGRISMFEELVHIAVGYPRNDMMDLLEASSQLNGCRFIGLPKHWHAGPFWMPDKVTLVKTYLDTGEIDLGSVVMSTDAYDVVIAEHASVILEKFRATGADILMGVEASFHPAKGRDPVKAQFDVFESKWRYINGGGYIGYGWAVRQLADYVTRRLESKDYDYHEPNDQALQQQFFLAHQNSRELRVRLDTGCDIFCCLNSSTDDFVVSRSRVRHHNEHNTVSVLHANGGKHNLDVLTRYWSLIGGATGGRSHDLRLATVDGAVLAYHPMSRKLVASRPQDPCAVFFLVKGDRHAIAVTAEHGLLTFDRNGGIGRGATTINPHELLSLRETVMTCHGTTLDAYCAPSKSGDIAMAAPTLSLLRQPWFGTILELIEKYEARY
jgi:hypothetical protein